MLDDDGHAIIIDFDSCASSGTKSRGGTPGWSTSPNIAEVANDEHGFNLVARFIWGQYDGQDFAAFGMWIKFQKKRRQEFVTVRHILSIYIALV